MSQRILCYVYREFPETVELLEARGNGPAFVAYLWCFRLGADSYPLCPLLLNGGVACS
jgi:hypothetical protein